MTQNLMRDYDFVLEANKTLRTSVNAKFIKVHEFVNSDPSKAVNMQIRLNNGVWTKMRAGTSMDFTAITPSTTQPTGDDSVTSIDVRNAGDSTISGTFTTSLGKILDNTLALDDSTTTNGIPSSITNTPLPVVDIASLDDSGIILNSEQSVVISPIRGNAVNSDIIAPHGYTFAGQQVFNYTGLESGSRYAYDLERIESTPQWWGSDDAQSTLGPDFRFELVADVRVFAYNGQGATQKRGYRRGGLMSSWSGEIVSDPYGNLQNSLQNWRHCGGALSTAGYAGSLTFFEQSTERQPFIFDASATTLSLQFLITGELRFDQFGNGAGAPFKSNAPAKGWGGFRVRSSIQPINTGALT